MNGRVKTNSAFLRVAMLSLLVTGAEASMRHTDASSQTETVRSMCTVKVFKRSCLVISLIMRLATARRMARNQMKPTTKVISPAMCQLVVRMSCGLPMTQFLVMMLMMLAIFLYCQCSLRSQVQTLNDQVASLEQKNGGHE